MFHRKLLNGLKGPFIERSIVLNVIVRVGLKKCEQFHRHFYGEFVIILHTETMIHIILYFCESNCRLHFLSNLLVEVLLESADSGLEAYITPILIAPLFILSFSSFLIAPFTIERL